MIRSMYTAISSLHLHQYFMDVVADNLGNANTYGFKASRFTLQDQFSQVMSVGSAATDTQGGVNPVQIGLGTRVGTSTPVFTQGPLTSTGRTTDLAIQGDGFLIYKGDTTNLYSRDGMLEIDSLGYLVNPATGLRVQGWSVTSGSTVDTGQAIDDIQLPIDTSLAQATENAIISGNLNSTIPTSGSASSYNMTFGVYDSLGVMHSITTTYTHTGDLAWSWSAAENGTNVGSGALSFDGATGQSLTASGSVTVPGANGADAATITLDFSTLSQLATESSIAATSQDGLAAGSLTTFVIAPQTGEVYGQFSNGMQQLLGQVALAKFINPSGLVRNGQNLFEMGLNSGEPSIGAAGTGGRGVIVSGHLEGSNVDMAQEFTNMILAQRGFQASSRVITTSDQMLQELVNIQR